MGCGLQSPARGARGCAVRQSAGVRVAVAKATSGRAGWRRTWGTDAWQQPGVDALERRIMSKISEIRCSSGRKERTSSCHPTEPSRLSQQVQFAFCINVRTHGWRAQFFAPSTERGRPPVHSGPVLPLGEEIGGADERRPHLNKSRFHIAAERFSWRVKPFGSYPLGELVAETRLVLRHFTNFLGRVATEKRTCNEVAEVAY